MTSIRTFIGAFSTLLLFSTGGATKELQVLAGPKPGHSWKVKDIRRGMKGFGLTVMKGTNVQTFKAEVIGVLRNTSPGRDMVLCKLSGLDLERSGIIAGMSGSPVYIQNKLLGAVAYGWAYGKDPIAGITPFSQMHGFVEAYEKRDLARKKKLKGVGRHRLSKPIRLGNRSFDRVRVSQSSEERVINKDELWLTPLRMPLAATGFSRRSLSVLRQRTRHLGLVPMQGGGAGKRIQNQEKETPLVPGGSLAVTLIRGDFDLSGIGTVTHIEGNRVYGWGHPFMSLGACDLPLMTGYVHTIYPRQSVSFKMGSPLRTVGVINADVSTGIAGWLGRKPDMIPMTMKVRCDDASNAHTFNVELARQPSLLATLVFTALSNSIDMEGRLPDEITANFTARLEVEGYEPFVIKDTFSGFSGSRAAANLYAPVASLVRELTRNDFKPVRIKRITCETRIYKGRSTAEIHSVELDQKSYEPGETLKATVYLKPYKGEIEKVRFQMKLPVDLEEGTYQASFSDESSAKRYALRDNPTLYYPRSVKKLVKGLRIRSTGKRTTLAFRIPIGASGVSVQGKDHPNLPGSMVQILQSSRRSSGSRALSKSLIRTATTDWVLEGRETVSIQVKKRKRTKLK